MRVLALETATFTASVALVDGATGATLAARELYTASLSAALLPLAQACLDEAGVRAAQLDAIAVGSGPGSFTGLRIGLATAKGLAFALDRPLWLASSLHALAADAPGGAPDEVLVAALDARRGELYAGAFVRDAGGALVACGDERVLAPGGVAAWLAQVAPGRPVRIVGDALVEHGAALAGPGVTLDGGARATPSAASVARLAAAGDRRSHVDGGAPAYVRRPEVELMYPDGVPGAARRALT